jgi:hypothetical protein
MNIKKELDPRSNTHRNRNLCILPLFFPFDLHFCIVVGRLLNNPICELDPFHEWHSILGKTGSESAAIGHQIDFSIRSFCIPPGRLFVVT